MHSPIISKMSTLKYQPLFRYQFTWNNYTDTNVAWVREFADEECKYLTFGYEVGESGTPHLQGFFILKSRQRIPALKKKGLDAHLTPNDKKVDCARIYCQKDGKFEEFGAIPTQGARNDIESFKAAVRAGTDWVTLLDTHSDVCKKHRNYCAEFFSHFKPKVASPDGFKELEWHKTIHEILDNKDYRKIHFIIDVKGNLGKSWLTRHLFATRDDVQFFSPEKDANIAHMVDESKSVYIFDVPRCRTNNDIPFPYKTLEELKNGALTSGKYESRMKFPKTPNAVIVFANAPPDAAAFSKDRYNVLYWIPKKEKFGTLVPNAVESWDLYIGKSRIDTIENPQVEKARQKRHRQSMQDELLEIRLKKEKAAKYHHHEEG